MLRNRFLTIGALVALGIVPFVMDESRGQSDVAAAKDQHGDPLPKGALARIGTVRWRHAGTAVFAAFLADGKSVVSVGSDQIIHVWEYPSGKEIRRFDNPPADQDRLVLAAPAFLNRFIGPAVALSGDGKILACNFRGSSVQLYNVATGKALPPLKGVAEPEVGGFGSAVNGLAFSPDSQHLAVLSPTGNIQVWDWAKAKKVLQVGKAKANLRAINANTALAYAPDGKWLVSSQTEIVNGQLASSLKLWDANAGQELRTLAVSKNNTTVQTAVFSPDGDQLALVHSTGAVKVVDTANGKELAKFMVGDKVPPGRAGPMVSVVFSRDGKSLFTRSLNSPRVHQWSIDTGKEMRQLGIEPGNQTYRAFFGGGGVSSLMFSPNGDTLAFAGFDQVIHFIDVASGKELAPPTDHNVAVRSVKFTPDGKQLWTQQGNDTAFFQWDAATGKALGQLKVPGGTVSPNGQYVAALSPAMGTEIQILEVATGKVVGRLPPQEREFGPNLVFSPDGQVLAVRWRAGEKIALYAVPSGKLLHTAAIVTGEPPLGAVIMAPVVIAPATMTFSPDSKTLLAYSEPGKLALWDVATGKKLKNLPLPQRILGGFGAAAFSPDGRCVAFDMRDGTVVLCELATGLERRVYGKPPLPVKGGLPGVRGANFADGAKVAFSADGTRLAQAGVDRIVHVWDVRTGQELASLAGHTGSISCVAFTPDGKMLASASADTTALVWDVAAVTAKPFAARILTAAELQADWGRLSEPDAAKGFEAICELTDSPKETLALLKEHLKPAPPLDAARVQTLLMMLDSDVYKERQQATAELLKLGERTVPAMEKALAAGPPLELKQRLEGLIKQLAGATLTAEQLRAVRAVEVLERLGTAEARQLLQSIAEGAPGAMATTNARAALGRLQAK
jgi:WD40 repeat protein